jgi:glutamate synthase domain-containing protein 3
MKEIDAQGLHYRDLNKDLRKLIAGGAKSILVKNVCGQRFIGDNIAGDAQIIVEGVPGNDLASFMDGPRIIVRGNAQDAVGNTMNRGEVIIYGDAGDIVGYAMRGGRIFIQGNVGYRVGIHMKAYEEFFPVVIAGGGARDFLGEYMAGGLLVILGLNGEEIAGDFIGTGMHGGALFLRGEVEPARLGREVKIGEITHQDMDLLRRHIGEFCSWFGLDREEILQKPFSKIYPYSHRPYGTIYTY